MTKKTSGKKPSSRKESLTETSPPKQKAPLQMEERGFVPGNRVKCKIDIDTVKAGTPGTVTQILAGMSRVLFDGATLDTPIPNEFLEPA